MTLRKKGILFIVLLSVWCSFTAAFSHQIDITGVHVTTELNHVRFVFNATAPVSYHSFQLANPHRLVIDISHAQLTQPLIFPEMYKNLVTGIRSAPQPNGGLRLVLDLGDPLQSKNFALSAANEEPYSLTINFSEKGKTSAQTSPPVFPRAHQEREPLPIYTAETKKPRQNVIIVIDPGHGGKDPGATGQLGTHEKNIVLAISKRLQAIMNQQPGFHAVLTRNDDTYISLRRRLAIARHYKADMFVAIHADADAYPSHSARGASVYALSSRGATSEAARWLAKRENESELMGGVDLSDKGNLLKSVLINLSQTATIQASLMIGGQMIHSLDQIARLHHYRVEQAAFVVLKSPDIPSLLVETGFLSNHLEERRLRDPSYQNRLALSIMEGIRSYFTHHPPPNTWLEYWLNHPNKRLADRR